MLSENKTTRTEKSGSGRYRKEDQPAPMAVIYYPWSVYHDVASVSSVILKDIEFYW